MTCSFSWTPIKDIAPCTADHLRVILASEDDKKTFVMELAAVVDAGEPFVKVTYNLEGDGLLIFSAYLTIQALAIAAAQRHYPNLAAKAEELGATPAEKGRCGWSSARSQLLSA